MNSKLIKLLLPTRLRGDLGIGNFLSREDEGPKGRDILSFDSCTITRELLVSNEIK